MVSERQKCSSLGPDQAGQVVQVSGWVDRRRDHGGLIFVDLRDRSGIVQCVFDPSKGQVAYTRAEKIRSEYVLTVRGLVTRRPEGLENPALASGKIEIYVQEMEVLSEAKTPPFDLHERTGVDETVRLRHRYLDLRRKEMQKNIILRHRLVQAFRSFLNKEDFLEIETPMLIRSTPEGARDYLVPSRVFPGNFYALPQSPQLYKQLLMVSGFERYYQVARCFRDEDLRADRQPEFTQLDMELSFMDREQIMGIMERMVAEVLREVMGKELALPFPRMTWQEAMDRYGSDRPDTRFGLELVDLSDVLKDAEFKVFRQTLQSGGKVKGIRVPGGSGFSRRELDELTNLAQEFGAKGLAWMSLTAEGIKSPIAKFFTEDALGEIVATLEGQEGDLLLFVADQPKVVADVLGRLRLELGQRLGLIENQVQNFLWVTHFPLLEWDAESKRYVAVHHPFTAPLPEDLGKLQEDPGSVRANAYDLVLNGVEIGGGSIRIHQRPVQEQVFRALGFTDEAAKDQFGFLLEAFEYGTPPHGGIAFGLDRFVMLLAGANSIREVMAFPKTQKAFEPMTEAPAEVDPAQLRDLGIAITAKKEI